MTWAYKRQRRMNNSHRITKSDTRKTRKGATTEQNDANDDFKWGYIPRFASTRLANKHELGPSPGLTESFGQRRLVGTLTCLPETNRNQHAHG